VLRALHAAQGIEFLRETLHLPAETVPATLKKSEKPQAPPSFGAFAFVAVPTTSPLPMLRSLGRSRSSHFAFCAALCAVRGVSDGSIWGVVHQSIR
jgi:hypothetical protein